jgi:DNA-binding transcriptional MerR regulator
MDRTKTAVPDKLFYKAAEVCELTDTQPYVLRFWESEFPQLASEKNRSGQKVYRRQDIDLILRIKKLLYEEEYTIAGARKAIDAGEATVIVEPPVQRKGRR